MNEQLILRTFIAYPASQNGAGHTIETKTVPLPVVHKQRNRHGTICKKKGTKKKQARHCLALHETINSVGGAYHRAIGSVVHELQRSPEDVKALIRAGGRSLRAPRQRDLRVGPIGHAVGG